MVLIPVPGLVVRYSYLWAAEHDVGREDGSKDRPCVVVLAVNRTGHDIYVVTVVPITHSPPQDMSVAIEISRDTKIRLQLDDQRSWIVMGEANQFPWPGPDLRPIPGRPKGTFAYGILPYNIIAKMRSTFIAAARAKLLSIVPRTE